MSESAVHLKERSDVIPLLLQVLEGCFRCGAFKAAAPALGGAELAPRNPLIARLQIEDTGSATSRGSSGGFGGIPFWAALRQLSGLEAETRTLLGEARAVLRRRSVLPLMVRRTLSLLTLRCLSVKTGTASSGELAELGQAESQITDCGPSCALTAAVGAGRWSTTWPGRGF